MRIFWQEMHKIWRPAPVLTVLLLVLLSGQTMLRHHFTLPKEGEHERALSIYENWRKAFGTTLDPDELPEVQQQLANLTEDANMVIQNWNDFKNSSWASFSSLGITDYEEYCALIAKPGKSLEENEVAALLLDSRSYFLHFQIQLVRGVLEEYEFEQAADLSKRTEANSPAAAPRELARCAEIASDPTVTHSVFYGFSAQAANQFAAQLALILLLAVLVLVSPCLVRERLARMTQEQWPTRTGRRLLRYQLAAALVSAAVVSITLTAVLGWRFCAAWRAGSFWDCVAYSVSGSPIPWFTLTYGQYLLLLGGSLICLGIAGGALAFFLSRFSRSYIAMLLKAVPLYFMLACAANAILPEMLYFGNVLSGWTDVPGVELMLTAAVLCGGLLLNIAAAHSELRREL